MISVLEAFASLCMLQATAFNGLRTIRCREQATWRVRARRPRASACVRGSDGELHEASWPDAIEAIRVGLTGVKDTHGADALAFISSSRCTGEENYLMQKLSRAVFGTNNIHQCAAT